MVISSCRCVFLEHGSSTIYIYIYINHNKSKLGKHFKKVGVFCLQLPTQQKQQSDPIFWQLSPCHRLTRVDNTVAPRVAEPPQAESCASSYIRPRQCGNPGSWWLVGCPLERWSETPIICPFSLDFWDLVKCCLEMHLKASEPQTYDAYTYA